MNILLLAENWPPRIGGIENYLTQIAHHLPTQSVSVIAPKARDISTDTIQNTGIKSVERKRFFWPLIKPTWLPLYIQLHRRARREKIDLVLCGKALFEGQIGYYLKKHLGIPYVVCTYAMEIAQWSKQGSTRRKLQRVLSAADRIVYINEITKKHLLELGAREQQLVKIWPGVASQFFAETNADQDSIVLAKYNLQPQQYIISVARLVERKGLDVLIEAFAALDQTQFSNLKLAIAGAGPQLPVLQKSARQNLIESSVSLLGEVPDADLPALYRNAVFFALTPRDVPDDLEGFGIVYIEAAAAGVPSVATRTGGASEAVVDKKTGLVVTPDSVEAVAQGLKWLLTHTAERTALGAAAKTRAYNEFRWAKRILLVKGMIDAILAQSSLRRGVGST